MELLSETDNSELAEHYGVCERELTYHKSGGGSPRTVRKGNMNVQER